jgi:hypothetical protein
MKMLKEFAILVKSIKNNDFCVAGLEVERSTHGVRLLNNWIRPTSAKGRNGAVCSKEMALQDGRQPRFLDVIQIEVSGNEGRPNQPENWVMTDRPWHRFGRLDYSALTSTLADNPVNLWLGSDRKTERISTAEYRAFGYNSSIHIIQPEQLQVYIYSEMYNGRVKKRRRALIEYKGVQYDLYLTDMDLDKKYLRNYPAPGEAPRTIPLDFSRCLIAVSLTPELNGYYYKIAGKIIEL